MEKASAARRLGPVKTVATMIGASVGSVHRYVRDGDFPLPIKVGPGCTRWDLDEVEEWLCNRPRYVPTSRKGPIPTSEQPIPGQNPFAPVKAAE